MRAKKSLGQNFLRDEKVLEHIIQTADLKADDFVLEIGPGTGALTEKLVENSEKLICIEKDDALAKRLKKNHKTNEKIEIMNADVLEINLPEIIEKNNFRKYKLIANIPYYITSPIIRLFLEIKYPPREMILMVQREVAERICAEPGQESLLSISVKYYAEPKIIFEVDRKSFWPVPEVDSAVIKITPQKNSSDQEESKKFFRVVRAGFAAKRKTLLNNLSAGFHLGKDETEEKIKKSGLNPAQRAQELSLEDWKRLSDIF